MKITVTKKDIVLARKLIDDNREKSYASGIDLCTHCPIALAVKRKTHKAVSVRKTSLYVYENEQLRSIHNLPTVAKKFIRKFDNKKPVKPFAFETE